jgi:hypothetical protein
MPPDEAAREWARIKREQVTVVDTSMLTLRPEKETPMEMPRAVGAPTLLKRAAEIMEERGRQYDAEGGERSMMRTVNAFNAITGGNMTEAQGWLFMACLKQVRQWQKPEYHADSAEDGIAYAALLAECLSNGGAK